MDLWFGIATFVGAFAVGVALQHRRGRSQQEFAAEEASGLGHFARGDFDSAYQLFDNLYKDYWVDASANLVAGRHRAWALLRLGRIEEGQLQINDLIGRTDDAQFNGHVRLLRALVAQIGGAVPLDADLPLPGEIGSAPDGLWEMTSALVLIRQGQGEQAARSLQEAWRELEGRVSGDLFRLLRLVRAFAEHTVATTRDAGTLDALLAPLRSAPPGFARMLTAAWPEMRLFWESQSLP